MIEKFVKGQFTEDDLEQTIIHYFTEQGYGHVNAQEDFSDDNEGVLREGELAAFLKARYQKDGITDREVACAIAHLKNIHAKPLYAGVRETYEAVTSGWDMPRDKKPSGGVYLTTVQKFDEKVGLLSDRTNIICLSDEAHRTQTSLEGKLKFTAEGEVDVTHPFAQCLRAAFSQATYCGFTGTPIDETLNVFGKIVDKYTMNEEVEMMPKQTFAFCDVAGVFDEGENIEIYGEDFLERLKGVKMPSTKFNAMVRTLRRLLAGYAKKNAVKALEFEERLQKVMDEYNRRDKIVFTNKVVEDLCQQIISISEDLKKVEGEFAELGISVEEKAYYDILLKVRDDNKFAFAEEKSIELAKGIASLVGRMAQYPGWPDRTDLRSEFKIELIRLMHAHGYPPGFNDEIYERVLGQSGNFRHSGVLNVDFSEAPEESSDNRLAAFEDAEK